MKKAAIVIAILLFSCGVLLVLNPMLMMIPMALSGMYDSLHQRAAMEVAHQRAVESFVRSEGFGKARLRRKGRWNELTVTYQGVICVPLEVNLIGLTPEHGFRFFEGNEPPKKSHMRDFTSRALTAEELDVVGRLISKVSAIESLPATGALKELQGIRVFAPILSRPECLQCHPGQEGDVLGAFQYSLLPTPENQ